ncbi:MAG: S-ribosylhomocysteine lyase [Clostridia bacterium]|nr:S-ribosylhomocysteine lyase [Clostridia bacterium]MDR3645673.1 S-ribosylhomocysteine lyase [Clostridia bacterium]
MELQRIASFDVDHTKLKRGIYISRVDGDIVTYDLRMKEPNRGDYLENTALHTIEHLFATYVRNSPLSDGVIYFGPMGCRTGFYFITRALSDAQVIALTQEAFRFTADFEGRVPGSAESECGNFREHDLAGAKAEAERYFDVIAGWTPEMLVYRK